MRQEKQVWVVAVNTDLTEGRGMQKIIHVCDMRATALRLGKKKDVQGSDARVSQANAICEGGVWLAPATIVRPSSEDTYNQEIIDRDLAKKIRRTEAIERAEKAGLSADDIEALR